MKIIRVLLIASLLVPVAWAEDFKLEPGFISLYNGKDLTGWRYLPDEKFDGKTEASDGRYTAKGEALVVNDFNPAKTHCGSSGTTQEFLKNFIPKLEFRHRERTAASSFASHNCNVATISSPDLTRS
jgi:hypothetical protein